MEEQKRLGLIYQTAEGKVMFSSDIYAAEGYFEGRIRRLKSRGCNILYSNPDMNSTQSTLIFNRQFSDTLSALSLDEFIERLNKSGNERVA